MSFPISAPLVKASWLFKGELLGTITQWKTDKAGHCFKLRFNNDLPVLGQSLEQLIKYQGWSGSPITKEPFIVESVLVNNLLQLIFKFIYFLKYIYISKTLNVLSNTSVKPLWSVWLAKGTLLLNHWTRFDFLQPFFCISLAFVLEMIFSLKQHE